MGNVSLNLLGTVYGRGGFQQRTVTKVAASCVQRAHEKDPWWVTPQSQTYPVQIGMPYRRGDFRVSGVLSRDGQLFAGTVLLLERRSLRIVAETVSGTDGAYSFESVAGAPVYVILAFDGPRHSRPDLNATLVDWVVPEPMA